MPSDFEDNEPDDIEDADYDEDEDDCEEFYDNLSQDQIDSLMEDFYPSEDYYEMLDKSDPSNLTTIDGDDNTLFIPLDGTKEADLMGQALALADIMREDAVKIAEDEEDKLHQDGKDEERCVETFAEMMSLKSRHTNRRAKRKLSMFEQHIADVCAGKLPLFKED